MALSEKKKASNAKWDAKNLKRLSLAMLADDFEKMEQHIVRMNEIHQKSETRNAFINRAIKNTIASDLRNDAEK